MIVRPAALSDAAACRAIYGHHAETGFGTFEEAAPTLEEMQRRIGAVLERGLPYLVAEIDGAVAGFAYAAPFRLRAAYRYTVEDSVYVDPGHVGRGVGKAVLGAVVAACEAIGIRQLIAVIGDSANAGSIGLHGALGFERRGLFPGLGYKRGRWVDVVWMQKALNGGDSGEPASPGLDLHGV